MPLRQIGAHHPLIKQVRAAVHNRSPNAHLFVAEGLWAHNVVLDLAGQVEAFLWCPEAAQADEAHQVSDRMAAVAQQAYRISARVLEQITERDQPDGLVSLVRRPAWDATTMAFGSAALVLVADAIEIPGNLGTLLRTLDACAGDCLLLTNRRTKLSHPKVFRGSRGMSLRVPILEFDDAAKAVGWLRQRRFSVYLATTDAQATPYRSVDFAARTAIVVGNERYGVSSSWTEYDFRRVRVPMLGAADSLNVSVCASIMLYEIRARAAGW